MAPQSTHDIRMRGSIVVKRYVPPLQGEDERERDALELLAAYAPGLAPTPIRLERRNGRSELLMSRIDGRPLGDGPLAPREVRALARAMQRLHRSVPSHALDLWPIRRGAPESLLDVLHAGLSGPIRDVDPIVVKAESALKRSLEASAEATVAGFPHRRVFTNADGNLANYIWDGRECRVVDFEDAGVSDWAYEVADLLEHPTVALTRAFEPDAFIDLMDAGADDLVRLHRYRCVLAGCWFTLLLPGGPAERRNPRGSLDEQARRVLDLLEP